MPTSDSKLAGKKKFVFSNIDIGNLDDNRLNHRGTDQDLNRYMRRSQADAQKLYSHGDRGILSTKNPSEQPINELSHQQLVSNVNDAASFRDKTSKNNIVFPLGQQPSSPTKDELKQRDRLKNSLKQHHISNVSAVVAHTPNVVPNKRTSSSHTLNQSIRR